MKGDRWDPGECDVSSSSCLFSSSLYRAFSAMGVTSHSDCTIFRTVCYFYEPFSFYLPVSVVPHPPNALYLYRESMIHTHTHTHTDVTDVDIPALVP